MENKIDKVVMINDILDKEEEKESPEVDILLNLVEDAMKTVMKKTVDEFIKLLKEQEDLFNKFVDMTNRNWRSNSVKINEIVGIINKIGKKINLDTSDLLETGTIVVEDVKDKD